MLQWLRGLVVVVVCIYGTLSAMELPLPVDQVVIQANDHADHEYIMKIAQRMLVLKDICEHDKSCEDRQFFALFAFFNHLFTQQGVELLRREYPAVGAFLEQQGISLKMFCCELLSDMLDAFEGAVRFKQERYPNLLVFQYKQLRPCFYSAMAKQKKDILYWCECSNASLDVRFDFVFQTLNRVLQTQDFSLDASVQYVDLGEEGCLQTQLVAHALCMLGIRHLVITIINKPAIISSYALDDKMAYVKSFLCNKYPELVCSYDVCAHTAKASYCSAVKNGIDIKIFAYVDLSNDIDGWYINDYLKKSNQEQLALPINSLEFAVSFGAKKYTYAVTLISPLYASPCVLVNYIYPELIVSEGDLSIAAGHKQEITSLLQKVLERLSPEERQHMMIKNPDIFGSVFKSRLIKSAHYIIKSQEKFVAQDMFAELLREAYNSAFDCIIMLDGNVVL